MYEENIVLGSKGYSGIRIKFYGNGYVNMSKI